MADQIEDALIREVNEDLRDEQMRQLWNRFGGYVVAAAVLVVVIVAGYQGWKSYTTSARVGEGERFYAAEQMIAADPKGAGQALAALAKDATTGYGPLAKFLEASLLADQGDVKGAATLYQQVARETSSDPTLSSLAVILGAILEINAGGYDAADLSLRLNAIAGADNPYRFSARELLAALALDTGDAADARARFNDLAADNTAPAGIRQRAQEALLGLGQN